MKTLQNETVTWAESYLKDEIITVHDVVRKCIAVAVFVSVYHLVMSSSYYVSKPSAVSAVLTLRLRMAGDSISASSVTALRDCDSVMWLSFAADSLSVFIIRHQLLLLLLWFPFFVTCHPATQWQWYCGFLSVAVCLQLLTLLLLLICRDNSVRVCYIVRSDKCIGDVYMCIIC